MASSKGAVTSLKQWYTNYGFCRSRGSSVVEDENTSNNQCYEEASRDALT